MHWLFLESQWRREQLRTNLWFVPSVEVLGAIMLFAGTRAVDTAAYHGAFPLPPWVISGTADAARIILTTLAAAVITVIGVVFSIMIVTLTLASTQFGPRMLRTFIRDRGTQLTLGTFVATFVYATLTLVAIGPGDHGDFVPHVSITVSIALVLVDLGVLIYFIHHVATSIQLPQVIASIARDLSQAIEADSDRVETPTHRPERGPTAAELIQRMHQPGCVALASTSGYLQYIRHDALVRVAADLDAVIRLHYRPGHFLVQGHPLASVWPAQAAGEVARQLTLAHITGPHRTLAQDVAFAVDQLVEIAIRALSPAVNDTFTAMTCVDWLGDGLCKIARRWQPEQIHRDAAGHIRLITAPVSYDRLIERAFDKIRQSSRGIPAVMIRQLDALTKIITETTQVSQRQVLLDQAAMIQRANLESVPEQADQADVQRRYDDLLALSTHITQPTPDPAGADASVTDHD
jgi:uncharacterized membrane protein